MQCFNHPNITCRTEYPDGLVQSVCPKCLWRSKGIRIPAKIPPVQVVSLVNQPKTNIFDEYYINNEVRVESMTQKLWTGIGCGCFYDDEGIRIYCNDCIYDEEESS